MWESCRDAKGTLRERRDRYQTAQRHRLKPSFSRQQTKVFDLLNLCRLKLPLPQTLLVLIRWLTDPGWNSPNGGEKGVDIARRSGEVLEEIAQTYQDGNVLVVSHKATIRIMLCSLLGIDVGRFRDRLGMPVASVSAVEMTKNGPLLHVMGDRSHLRDFLRKRVGT